MVSAAWGCLVEAEGLWLEYVDARGELREGPLEVMWPARFEAAGQVQTFPSHRGQRSSLAGTGLLPAPSLWVTSRGWNSVS